MKKVLLLYGVVLSLFLNSCTTACPIKEKIVPVYKKPVHSCKKPGDKPVCKISLTATDMENFEALMDCLIERKVYYRIVVNYYECLEESFNKEDKNG